MPTPAAVASTTAPATPWQQGGRSRAGARHRALGVRAQAASGDGERFEDRGIGGGCQLLPGKPPPSSHLLSLARPVGVAEKAQGGSRLTQVPRPLTASSPLTHTLLDVPLMVKAARGEPVPRAPCW